VRTLGQAFAAICVLLFMISGVFALLVFNIEAKAFSSATYKQAFEDQRLYERMPVMLGTLLTTYIAENGSAVPFLQILTIEDWQNNITLLLPPEELKAMANNALDATFDYLNGTTNSAVISLLPVKAHLAGESGLQLVLEILRRQPACTPEQLTQMALGFFGGQIALCNPPEEAIGLMMPFLQSQLQTMTAIFPNEVTFIPGTLSGTPDDPRLRLNTVRSAIKLTPFIPALLLMAIAIFAVRSFTDWLTWWGWSFLLVGGISVLIALLGSPVIRGILRFLIQSQLALLLPPVLASSIAETAGAVARQMLTPILVQGLMLAVTGLGMIILVLVLPRRTAFVHL
jgi:hypothetical protein